MVGLRRRVWDWPSVTRPNLRAPSASWNRHVEENPPPPPSPPPFSFFCATGELCSNGGGLWPRKAFGGRGARLPDRCALAIPTELLILLALLRRERGGTSFSILSATTTSHAEIVQSNVIFCPVLSVLRYVYIYIEESESVESVWIKFDSSRCSGELYFSQLAHSEVELLQCLTKSPSLAPSSLQPDLETGQRGVAADRWRSEGPLRWTQCSVELNGERDEMTSGTLELQPAH
ncbi:hypothetical protein AOLI_G00119150 [Acnodon oligacanthus]